MKLTDVNRKGFCAIWITASPHEWKWTQAEQEEMARAVLDLDDARIVAEARVKELEAVVAERDRDAKRPTS